MKKRTALIPAVDSLESRLVLSQIAHSPMVAEMTAMAASARTTARKSIEGTLAGTVTHPVSNPDVGPKFVLSGSGPLKTLGMVQVRGTVMTPGFIQSGTSTGELTLSNARGTVKLALTGPTQPGFSPLPDTYSFVIMGGTRAYRSLSGHGTVAATWKPSADAPQHFQFTLITA